MPHPRSEDLDVRDDLSFDNPDDGRLGRGQDFGGAVGHEEVGARLVSPRRRPIADQFQAQRGLGLVVDRLHLLKEPVGRKSGADITVGQREFLALLVNLRLVKGPRLKSRKRLFPKDY